uniref:NADH-ubiquinone oxidoreductase chain 5 n=1 Tax=Staphylinidae sp. BMNH 1274668 TaxID=1796590 RepID=A0A140EFY7_9COLE|nr:NADH dehydrogenase subunit 5 [Staphylinidae sp. BMNH 1274668]
MIMICSIFSFLLIFMSLMSFINSLFFMMNDYTIFIEFELCSLNFYSIEMVILLDWMSLLFTSFVMFISSMVIFYSKEYMLMDLNIKRFILMIFLFVMSMMLMIMSLNLLSILIGWDGLGLISYCLVIYYQNIKSNNSGMVTALSNRIGDVMLLMSIAWMLNYGSWNFIFYLEFMKNDIYMTVISYMVMLAAFTKSAQIPFSSWLPMAMAAPTPVSSLVHSSTLVTAGVYLMIRFFNCLSDSLLMLMLFISMMTMFMAGLGANYEYDLKKIIALSTLSQLGLMLSILSLGELNLSFFHLLTHALFKATLFMCAGSMIHSLNDCQDIRYMGKIISQMPLTFMIFTISNLSLCGEFFLAGFYSKDLILEFLSMNIMGLFSFIIMFLSTGLTSMYTIRLSYYLSWKNLNFFSFNMLMEENYIMLKSMMIMVMMVCWGGSMLTWLILKNPYMIFLPMFMKLLILMVTIIGLILGVELFNLKINYSINSLIFIKLIYMNSLMWNMPIITSMMNYKILNISMIYNHKFDQGWYEYYGSQNLYMNYVMMSKFYQLIFSNNFKLFFMLLIMYIMIIILI